MLGRILDGLTDPTTAETVLAVVGGPDIRSRIEQAAATGDSPVGELIAGKVRHLLDHGGEDVWLDLVATMSDTLQPGTAAVDRILARAFPDPVRVRITRTAR